MAHIQWKDRFNVHYKKIDEQHRGLVEILNDLLDLISRRSGPERVGPLFHRLFEYTQVHFTYEERFMRKARFVGVLAHKAEHSGFIQKLMDLNQRYDASNPKLLEETLEFLQHWYLHHIMDMDMKYVPVMQGLFDKCEIRAIVFDSGSVLFRFDLRRFGERIAMLTGTAVEAVMNSLASEPAVLRDYARGNLSSGTFTNKVGRLCNTTLEEREFAGAYAEAFQPEGLVLDLLPRLKPACKLALVAAGGEWHSERVLDPSAAIGHFDVVSLSWRLGIAPGDPLLLEDTLDKLDLISEECLFISADGAFLSKAREMLFHTLTFTGAPDLEEGLRKERVQV